MAIQRDEPGFGNVEYTDRCCFCSFCREKALSQGIDLNDEVQRKAFNEVSIPVTKTLTFIDKNGEKTLVSARIGTPVSKIIKAFNVTLNEQDRIIFGGPMTVSSIYSEDYPVQADTVAIIVQAQVNVAFVSE